MATNYKIGARGRELHTDLGPFEVRNSLGHKDEKLVAGYEITRSNAESPGMIGEERKEVEERIVLTSAGNYIIPVSDNRQHPVSISDVLRKINVGAPLSPWRKKKK